MVRLGRREGLTGLVCCRCAIVASAPGRTAHLPGASPAHRKRACRSLLSLRVYFDTPRRVAGQGADTGWAPANSEAQAIRWGGEYSRLMRRAGAMEPVYSPPLLLTP